MSSIKASSIKARKEVVRIRDVRVIDKDPSQCDTEVLRGGSIVDGLIQMKASELIPKPTEYQTSQRR